ncbi:hypothetical protein [Nocardioides sp. SYSU DS0663]|uniref:hypothetical protein n=1 Tax=Nocardioides sp. SYSU DS0663 TaxID=3416445 RepID=UPI003F4B58D7
MTFAPLIRTQSDLVRAWRALMQPLGWTRTSTWLMFIGPDDRPLGHLTEIDDCAGLPREGTAASFGTFLEGLTGDLLPVGSRVAFLRSRPGRGGPDAEDLAWARELYAATRAARLPVEVVYLATDDHVVAVPLDDAGLPRSA